MLHNLSVAFFGLTAKIHCKLVAYRFKFDDERVTKEDIKRALEEQYGGEEEVTFFDAYILV